MITVRPIFAGFGKAGEEVDEKSGVYSLKGSGTDLGCNLIIQEEIKRPSLLELEVRGEIIKKSEWTRLRIEIFDRDKPDVPATSFENDYLTVDLDSKAYHHFSFPVLGIVKAPYKVQFMVVGPADIKLEIKNVCIR